MLWKRALLMNNNMNTHKKIYHNYFYIVLFSFIIAIFIMLIAVVLMMRTIYEVPLHVFYSPARRRPTAVPLRKGTLTLSVKNEKGSYQAGERVTIVVSAESDERSISGYDVTLSYDSSKVTFSNMKNMQDDFQTFVKKSAVSPVVLTAVKKLETSTDSVFYQTSLAEFSFIVKSGIFLNQPSLSTQSASFDLGFVPGSTQDSNLIDTASEDILGKVSGVAITVSQ